MAKPETPAEVSERAQPPRPAQRVCSEPAPRVEQREPARNVVAPNALERNAAAVDIAGSNATDLKAVAAARRSLLEGAADTLVGRHHDLDAMEALDDLLDRDRLARGRDGVHLRDVRDHGEPGRIFRPHAGHYARSEDADSDDAWSRDARSDERSFDPDTSNDDSSDDAGSLDAGSHDEGARHDRASQGVGEGVPEPERPRGGAYLRREDIDAALLDDEDVIDDAVQAAQSEAHSESMAFGLPRVGAVRVGTSAARGAPKVPLATLEQPSSSRLELTPSPVPRVSLTPATGAVDISLVPGPNGSRNMPTLAAQHVLGRRHQRRPAAAVTLPPPNITTAREPGVGMDLARDVRSSRREIVWGLMIGLGLSLVLAGVGQTYLRDPMIADGMTPPTELESITLSARPEALTLGARPEALTLGARPEALTLGARPEALTQPSPASAAEPNPAASASVADANPSSLAAASPSSIDRTSGTGGSALSAQSSARAPRQSPPFAVAMNEGDPASLFAHARAQANRVPERATRGSAARARKAASLATNTPSFEQERLPVAGKSADAKSTESGGKAFESTAAPAPRTPLSPAESAGLGLDLPL
jgi:hypothetical protein